MTAVMTNQERTNDVKRMRAESLAAAKVLVGKALEAEMAGNLVLRDGYLREAAPLYRSAKCPTEAAECMKWMDHQPVVLVPTVATTLRAQCVEATLGTSPATYAVMLGMERVGTLVRYSGRHNEWIGYTGHGEHKVYVGSHRTNSPRQAVNQIAERLGIEARYEL